MHELSIAESLRLILEEEAQRQGFRRIVEVRLEVGKLSCAEPEALKFCFEEAMRGSVAEGAKLTVLEVEGEGWCGRCARRFSLEAFELVCPTCGETVEIVRGQEMRLVDLLVVD